MTQDPYAITPDESQKFFEKTKGKQVGIICPKRHYGKSCAVCDIVQDLFNSGEAGDRSLAGKHMAKLNFYVCAVFPQAPEELKIVQLGKLVGNQIVEGTIALEWTDIAHPKAGIGRCIQITKSNNGQHNTYQASISPNKADFDIPDSVMNSLPDLENIVDIVSSGQYDIYNVSQLKVGEKITIRICPDVKGKERNNKYWINAIWRHWGVSQGQVDGEEPFRPKLNATDDEDETVTKPRNEAKSGNQAWSNTSTQSSRRKNCFGRPEYHDPSADECISCNDFKACGREILG